MMQKYIAVALAALAATASAADIAERSSCPKVLAKANAPYIMAYFGNGPVNGLYMGNEDGVATFEPEGLHVATTLKSGINGVMGAYINGSCEPSYLNIGEASGSIKPLTWGKAPLTQNWAAEMSFLFCYDSIYAPAVFIACPSKKTKGTYTLGLQTGNDDVPAGCSYTQAYLGANAADVPAPLQGQLF